MIYKQAGSKYYWTKFTWQGKCYRKSTGATDKETARSIEAKIRSELAEGRFDMLRPKQIPTLGAFLKERFLPFIESTPTIKPKTREYYRLGAAHLLANRNLSALELTEIDETNIAAFAGRNKYSVSTLNRNLRTAPDVVLSEGEVQRDRVVTDDEMKLYLTACLQPWRTIACIMFCLGMRPSEVYALRWEQIGFKAGFIFVFRGKTAKAKRQLSLEPVRQILEHRHKEAGFPAEGWVFPADSRSGHIEQGSAKNQHLKAIARSGVKAFAPYSLRHTALTNLAGICDTFTLSTIAGHSSVRVTERYVHPQAKIIAEAFEKITEWKKMVIGPGHSEEQTEDAKTA